MSISLSRSTWRSWLPTTTNSPQGLPYASVRVDSLAADETISVDIRLPIAAMTMGSADGQTAPFAYVHTIIDSQKELVETNKANNLSVDSRDDIPAVAENQASRMKTASNPRMKQPTAGSSPTGTDRPFVFGGGGRGRVVKNEAFVQSEIQFVFVLAVSVQFKYSLLPR